MSKRDGLSLSCTGLTAGYGELRILHDIGFEVAPGEAVCIIGRNGMGKTTLLTSFAGRTTLGAGEIAAGDRSLRGMSRVALCRMGIALVPQEREVFLNLDVEENLLVADRRGSWTVERLFDIFPRLAERRRNLGSQLSGGEQQMLAIARALMASPCILLLDEPSEGLAPVIVDQLFLALDAVRQEETMTMLLVEQHVHRGLRFCPRALGLRNGRVVFDGPSSRLLESEAEVDAIMALQSAQPPLQA